MGGGGGCGGALSGKVSGDIVRVITEHITNSHIKMAAILDFVKQTLYINRYQCLIEHTQV